VSLPGGGCLSQFVCSSILHVSVCVSPCTFASLSHCLSFSLCLCVSLYLMLALWAVLAMGGVGVQIRALRKSR